MSVLGPMSLDVEPERDEKARQVLVQMPGHLLGARREPPSAVVAAGGALKLRFDGDATVTLTGLPGVTLSDDADCQSFTEAVELALVTAAQTGGYTGLDGKVIVADARLAELRDGKVRWDPETRRFAITSGRQGVTRSPRVSSVELLTVAGSIGEPLGFEGGTSVTGRLHRHKLPAPRAMTMEVRLELWASTQPEIASLSDGLCRVAPSRGAVRTLPALLATDALAGSDTLVLLAEGEPTLPISVLHLECAAGPRDRVSGRTFAPAILPADTGRIVLDGANPAMALRVLPTPLVPSPFDPAHPLPRGLSLTLGVQVAQGGAVGQVLSLCSLSFGGDPVLSLTATLVATNGSISVDVTAVSTFVKIDGTTAQATSTLRLPLSRLEAGVALHAAVVVASGVIELFADGTPQALDDPKSTPVPPVAAAGVLSAGTGMRFVLGAEGGNPLELRVSHVHLTSEPIGPFDPDLRTSVTRASRYLPGKKLQIARVGEKISADSRHTVNVMSVAGNTLKVFPELPVDFAAGRAEVFSEEHFFQQISLRRKDDLANHLYRLTGDYRVSALLEPDMVLAPSAVAEALSVEVLSLGSTADAASMGPGASANVV